MAEKLSFNDYMSMANNEYKELYCLYNEIIVVVDVLEHESRKRLRKLSDVDDGLDNSTPIDAKIDKQTRKFAKAILEFNEKIDKLLEQFKGSAKKTFHYFKKMRILCKDAESEINCLTEVKKKLRLLILIVQKFLNKILRLQSASHIFPNLSSELEIAKEDYDSNLKKVVVILRASLMESMDIVNNIEEMKK